MNDPLVQLITPHKLLKRSVPITKLKDAVLAANTFNRKYWLECAHVWMCKHLHGVTPSAETIVNLEDDRRLSDADLATLNKNDEKHVEAFVAEISYREIDLFSSFHMEPVTETIQNRLDGLLRQISEHCSFEKNNDAYLHALLKTKIPAKKVFILEPPFRTINEFYYDSANSITRPLMVRDGAATYEAISLGSPSPDSLASAIALLAEALDGKVEQLAVNSGIHRQLITPFAFVGSNCKWGDQIGLRVKDILYFVRPDDKYPIATIIYYWAKNASKDLFNALTCPEALTPGSGLYRFLT